MPSTFIWPKQKAGLLRLFGHAEFLLIAKIGMLQHALIQLQQKLAFLLGRHIPPGPNFIYRSITTLAKTGSLAHRAYPNARGRDIVHFRHT